jgi:hypothetical protein
MITTGAALLPVSMRGAGQASIRFSKLKVDRDQELLLAEVVETIIPTTDTPGGKALNLHLFVLKMVDDCHNAGEQKSFIAGLVQLDALAHERFGYEFVDCNPDQRLELLVSLKPGKGLPAELIECFKLTKQRTVQGYKISEYVMTKLLPHKMIPDAYDGYYPANKLGGQI